MGLQEVIESVRSDAAKLSGSKAANEANTKALLIEPLLDALGWNTGDLEAVEREAKVFEGTYLDYALKLDGKPRIYVEAKAIGEQLDGKKFVAQTLNYANNDGVVWCVLTNGIRFKIYKTNEPVAMDQKLLAETDLAGDRDPDAEKLRILRLISREAVADGSLDAFGDRVFTDTRVRRALADLAGQADGELHKLVSAQLGHPQVEASALGASLARVLDVSPHGAKGAKGVKGKAAGPSGPPAAKEYSLDRHLGGKSASVRELFESVDQWIPSIGTDVSRRIRKQYIAYFKGKRSFCTLEVQHQRVIAYLVVDPAAAKPWNDNAMRNVTNIGHFGMGNTEYSLRESGQIPELRQLIELAYSAGK